MPAPQLLSIAAKDRTIAIRYSQMLDDSSAPDIEDLAASSSNPNGPLVIESAVVFGDTLYVGVRDLMLVALINVSYSGAWIKNKAGEAAATFINQGAVNTSTGIDNTAPTLLANGIVANEEFVAFYFSEVLSVNGVPDAGAFAITQADLAQAFLSDLVEVYGNRVTLTLDGWVRNGASVKGAYAPPAASALADAAGNAVAAIAAIAATVSTSRLAIASMLSVYAAGVLLAQLPAASVAAYLASSEKRQMLKFGSRDVNNAMRYQGSKYDPRQVHEFPRVPAGLTTVPMPMISPANYAWPAYPSIGGEVWDYDLSSNRAIVPLDVKLAAILQANSIASGRAARLEAQHDGLQSQGVGSLSESYVGTAAGSAAPKLCNEAFELLKRYELRSGAML